jgi:hypothetical protein
MVDVTTEEARAEAELVGVVQHFVNGIQAEQACGLLAETVRGWGFESFVQLARVVSVVSASCQLKPAAVLFWMHSTVLVTASPPGREMLYRAGLQVARKSGVSGSLLDQLPMHLDTTCAPKEMRH